MHPIQVHADLALSLGLVRRYRPRRALFVGVGHEMEHHATNRRLRALLSAEGIDAQLARDGQFVPLPGLALSPVPGRA